MRDSGPLPPRPGGTTRARAVQGARSGRDCLRLLGCLRDAGAVPATAFLGLSLAVALLPAATALATGRVIRSIEPAAARGPGAAQLTASVLVLAVVLVVSQAATAMQRPVTFLASGRITGAHRRRVAALAVDAADLERLETRETQDLVDVASGETSSWVERTVGDGSTELATLVTQYAGAVASGLVLARFAWWLLPLVLLPALAITAVGAAEAAEQRDLVLGGLVDKRRFMYFGQLSIAAQEGKEIRVFGLTDWVVNTGRQFMRRHTAPVNQAKLRRVRQRWFSFVLTVVPLAGVYLTVGVTVSQHRSLIPAESAVLACAWSVFAVIASTWNLVNVIGGLAPLRALRRLAELLPPVERDQPPIPGAAGGPAPQVRLRGVCFRYRGAARPVLSGLDLEIGSGEMLAIVGLNGAGKSTLTKVISGLYTPQAGSVSVNGAPLSPAGAARWQQLVTVVFQDFVRYRASVRDNVILGRAGRFDPGAMEAAAQAAGLDALLPSLPQGWDTVLDRTAPGGIDLSGGQWQQLALTRALYAVGCGARLLVLDEPTAHLDVQTELGIFERLREARSSLAGRASIVLISHRLSSVRWADRIVLLEDGRITETGTHAELLAAGSGYARMFRLQAERFERGTDDGQEARGATDSSRGAVR